MPRRCPTNHVRFRPQIGGFPAANTAAGAARALLRRRSRPTAAIPEGRPDPQALRRCCRCRRPPEPSPGLSLVAEPDSEFFDFGQETASILAPFDWTLERMDLGAFGPQPGVAKERPVVAELRPSRTVGSVRREFRVLHPLNR